MKRLFSYVDLALWTAVLFVNILILTRGEQIPSLIGMIATLLCFLDRLTRLIQDKEISIEVTTKIPGDVQVVLPNETDAKENTYEG